MLILQRKPGESVLIGEEIQVTVLSVDGGRARLAISAPRQVSILRSELAAATAETNQDAAREESAPAALLELLGGVLQPQSGDSPAAPRQPEAPSQAPAPEAPADSPAGSPDPQ